MSALLQADRPASESLLPEEPELFEQTVPRTLVHRAAVSEVLLTGFRPTGADAYRVGAQWSRGHSYYGAVAGRWHDPMLFAESIRQIGLFLAHEALQVPLGAHFVTDTTSFEMTEDGARIGARPAHVCLDVMFRDVVRRGSSVKSYAYDVVAHRDGVPIGTGRLSAQIIAPGIYRRLRGERLGARPSHTVPAPLRPALVGRDAESDVVLADGPVGGVRTLRADASHPVLFDHPVDHIPGMVLLEAARQAALAELGCPEGLLVSGSASFDRYVEYDSPCLVTSSAPCTDAAGHRQVDVDFRQSGVLAGTCRVAIHQEPGW
ncbi:ScbA/BarX family gamma-butyrolactone biosynthesis protein [Streptomyces sp. LHD-70]|uniref:ScbA/BarX family gamma-butyrolactone biosynthesis protein n=1 Tax=Streptomyces sp. LHD-70 TaxID=3072140 RepID=UPI00280D98F9|nr:ScbA/BarX family gamma-butyrolactone biosynthesis protein [Streptomyces sp. LHD-70]MDQ8706880.1 ScbA/BarX family gamma-butyrolactone biosynthesis protein [Streptomyces sp. LHD-70]